MMMMIMAVVVTDDHGSFSLKVYDLYCVEPRLMTVYSGNLILALNSSRRMNKRPEGKYLEKFSQYTKWNDVQRI